MHPEAFLQRVSVDSRNVKQGDIFFALKGERVDGHAFLSEVAAKKASAAVVNKSYQGPAFGLKLIAVEDPLHELQRLTKAFLTRFQGSIIAITGSVGKTTTKDFLTALLSQRYRVMASPGNANSQIGLPLAILNHVRGNEEVLILEMGMTESGNIASLVDIAPPDIALITRVGLAHAGNFEDVAAIGRAKGEIFSHPKTRLGFLHHDIDNLEEICRIGNCAKLSFSMNDSDADYFLRVDGNHLHLREPKSQNTITFPKPDLPGTHTFHNLLAAVAVARHLELTPEEIAAGIHHLRLPPQRFQKIEKDGITIINDTYNAYAISTIAALESLPDPALGGKRIAVLGEMVELGKFSVSSHEEVARYALKYVDAIVCFGERCRPIQRIWHEAKRPVDWAESHAEIADILKRLTSPGDIVLLKGSRPTSLEKVLDLFP